MVDPEAAKEEKNDDNDFQEARENDGQPSSEQSPTLNQSIPVPSKSDTMIAENAEQANVISNDDVPVEENKVFVASSARPLGTSCRSIVFTIVVTSWHHF